MTFADGQRFTTDRIAAEVSGLSFFDEVRSYGPNDLCSEFRESHREHLKIDRGYGLWSWKPWIIRQEMDQLALGDFLVYADSGCSLAQGADGEAFWHILSELHRHSVGMAVADGKEHKICHWTKADLLAEFNVRENDDVLHSRMWEAGRLGLVKTAQSEAIISAWQQLSQNIHFIDDSPSDLPELPEFVEHRHDQSIFNMVSHGHDVLTGMEKVLAATRLDGRGKPHWN